MNTTVAISKVKSSIEDSVKKAVKLLGGMESIINKGDKVYLKPNFVAPRDSSEGVTTNFEIIRVVAEEIHRCGGIPILFEIPAVEFDQKKVYDFLGVHDFARQNGIHLVEEPLDLIKVPVPNGKVLKSLKIPKILHNALIINLPKLKTHVSAQMTCGMKNLIGLLPNSQKSRVHIWGVHPSIADINTVFHPVLTIVDAVSCMEGDGPTYGDKIELGLIVAGKNPLSVDKVCSRIIGLHWENIKYMRLSDSQCKREKVNIIGETLEEVCTQFKIPQKNNLFHHCFRLIYLIDSVFSKIFSQNFNAFLYSFSCIFSASIA